jgi:hypothetical protein
MHVTGTIVLHGEEISIDCYSVRDRSWGPRPTGPGRTTAPAGERTRASDPKSGSRRSAPPRRSAPVPPTWKAGARAALSRAPGVSVEMRVRCEPGSWW